MALGATHYRWRRDVRRLVRRFERRFPTKANTYEDHPTGWHLDDVSVDFWSPAGRGSPINRAVGDHIVRRLTRKRRRLRIRWWIWRGRIHYGSGWSEAYNDPDDQHYDHVHVTFW